MTKVVLVTGGFDPLHSGHIEYFNSAKKLGDELIVGINSDDWLIRKKGKPFLPFEERIQIIQNLQMVDGTVSFDDSDGSSCGAIFKLMCTSAHNKKIIFANGGDRTAEDIPELKVYGGHPQIEFVFGVGGSEKKNSSSWILAKWPGEIIERPWGWYRVIDQGAGYKVKELEIYPGGKLSMQRHKHRAERWNVVQGSCMIKNPKWKIQLDAHCTPHTIDKMQWHQPCNITSESCKVIEVQIGDICNEADIERHE
jgi:cytidyltransferase-like protein